MHSSESYPLYQITYRSYRFQMTQSLVSWSDDFRARCWMRWARILSVGKDGLNVSYRHADHPTPALGYHAIASCEKHRAHHRHSPTSTLQPPCYKRSLANISLQTASHAPDAASLCIFRLSSAFVFQECSLQYVVCSTSHSRLGVPCMALASSSDMRCPPSTWHRSSSLSLTLRAHAFW